MQRILSMLVAVGITVLLFAIALFGAAWFMNDAATWALMRAPWFRDGAVIFNCLYVPIIVTWGVMRAKSPRAEPEAPFRLPRISR